MVGDSRDILRRLKAVLPARWFGESVPVLDALLGGYANAWESVFGLLQYVRNQSRMLTASDQWLDMIAHDFLGDELARRTDEIDSLFRRRIQQSLLRERGTRHALRVALEGLTGRAPVVFEPARPEDTGGYGSMIGAAFHAGGGAAYCTAGGWGSLDLPFQFFVTAFRPLGAGVVAVCGWGDLGAGYGIGALEYVSLEMTRGAVTDQDIFAKVTRVVPAATIGWTRVVG